MRNAQESVHLVAATVGFLSLFLIWLAAAHPATASSTTPTRAALAIRALPWSLIGPIRVRPDRLYSEQPATRKMRER